MRTPSIKAIKPLTRGSGDAKLVKLALTESMQVLMDQYGEKFPLTLRWTQNCYFRPKDSEIRRRMVDEALGTYGVEWVESDEQPGGLRLRGGRSLAYCNTGDSYGQTICWEFKLGLWGGKRLVRVFVGSWGDWVERWESRAKGGSGWE